MAPFWLLKEFLPGMVNANRGHIVTISSVMGHAGVAQMSTLATTFPGLTASRLRGLEACLGRFARITPLRTGQYLQRAIRAHYIGHVRTSARN